MGGAHHPMLKFLGVMSAKNTAVNILILSTYVSFLLYRRGNKHPSVEGAKTGQLNQVILVSLSFLFAAWMANYAHSLASFAYPPSVSECKCEGYLFPACACPENLSMVNTPPSTATTLSWAGTVIFSLLSLVIAGSYIRYRQNNKAGFLSWAEVGNSMQFWIFVSAICYVIFIGIYGYAVPTAVRIKMSVPQVLSVLFTMILVTVLDVKVLRNPKEVGGIQWGKMRPISQYALFLSAITFTWLMGLMGYVRSGLRQHWHVYGIMRDTSPDAFTPTLGFASKVVSVTVLLFFTLVAFIFWLASLSSKKDHHQQAEEA